MHKNGEENKLYTVNSFITKEMCLRNAGVLWNTVWISLIKGSSVGYVH
jgi:hypothetical protein